MGAVANLAPELFAGILAEVPFVDALTTILDPSLPLTVIEWDEWGDPLHDADQVGGMVCFFTERLDLVVDGEPQVRPRTPWA